MRIHTGILVLTGIAAVSGTVQGQADGGNDEAVIVVKILNRAGVPARELHQATTVARRVFEQAGVLTRWLDCTPDELGFMPEGRCERSATPMDLTVRIVTRPSGSSGVTLASFGLATYPDSGFPSWADIFHERSAGLAGLFGAEVALILGHAMAHEVGHLLLGKGNHARSGIMTGQWGSREVILANRGEMRFSRGQVSSIKASVRARAGR